MSTDRAIVLVGAGTTKEVQENVMMQYCSAVGIVVSLPIEKTIIKERVTKYAIEPHPDYNELVVIELDVYQPSTPFKNAKSKYHS